MRNRQPRDMTTDLPPGMQTVEVDLSWPEYHLVMDVAEALDVSVGDFMRLVSAHLTGTLLEPQGDPRFTV